ncbi:MAG: alcohol dehydrogenase catalytic domain-containing protein [Herpetosiphonaceae bacterium]|nr:alcohol dehydrogenase catalytic domain-containing protein [Herpetosiphonaceae bacterium]
MHKVVLAAPNEVRIVDGTPAQVETGQALVRLRLAGICGSDLSAFRGTSPMVTYPRVIGHELLVDVVECIDRPELVGRRAVVDPMVRCGKCRACRMGRYNCCSSLRVMGVHLDGGMQEVTAVESHRLFPVADSMPDDVAVLAEPLTVAYHAVERSEIRAGETAVVFGAGAIGLLIAQLLVRARGCRALVIDIDSARLQIAQSLGAMPLQGDEQALTEAVAAATDGEMAGVVFEATGIASCTRMTTALVAQAGRIVLVGWNKGPVEVDTVALMRKEADLLGSRNSMNAFPAVLQLLADGVIDANVMITHRFGLTEAGAALELLNTGQENPLKILIEAV